MKNFNSINIKSRPYYFFNNVTNIKDFGPNSLSINQITFEKNIDCVIYEIDYFKYFDGSNSLYLIFSNVDAHIEYNPTENDSETKYLVFTSTEKTKEVLKNSIELGNEVKYQIKTISSSNLIEYGKYFMKTRFESNDDLPLGEILNIPECIIVVKNVFQKNNNYYPQVLLYDCLYKY